MLFNFAMDFTGNVKNKVMGNEINENRDFRAELSIYPWHQSVDKETRDIIKYNICPTIFMILNDSFESLFC